MHTKTLKDTAISLLIGMVGMSYAHADTTGTQYLPSTSTAVDTFVLTCPTNTNYAKAYVSDLTTEVDPNNTSAFIFVTVIGPSGSAVGATDTSEGGASSLWTARVADGLGPYDVTFEKITVTGSAASGVEYYNGTANCYSPANANLGGALD